MIYDRTVADVNLALEIISKKVKQFVQLTDKDVQTLERGTITINTLNRIESKQNELRSLFNDLGYWNTDIQNKTWTFNDIFSITDFERILRNTDILREAFYVYSSTPSTPQSRYHYEVINSIEKILYDLEQMIDDMKSKYRECGTFQCGEVNSN
jgi:uncharacterized membrane protein YgaE (UPF0421/DUF939 family)